MTYQVEQLSDCQCSITLDIPQEEVKVFVDEAVNRLKKQVKVSGFRKGKVPSSIIKSRYKSSIIDESLKEFVPKFINEVVKEEGLSTVGSPMVKEIELETDKNGKVVVILEVWPKIDVKSYDKFDVSYDEVPDVSKDAIKDEIEQLRMQHAQFMTIDDADKVKKNQVFRGDLKVEDQGNVLIDQQDEQFVLEEKLLPKALIKALSSIKIDETKTLDVEIGEDENHPELVNKTLAVTATLKAVEKRNLPKLDDDFAQDCDFESLKDLKKSIKTKHTEHRDTQIKQAVRGALAENIISQYGEFDVPKAFVAEESYGMVAEMFRSMMPNAPEPDPKDEHVQKLMESTKDEASKRVRLTILLDSIGKDAKIEVKENEINDEIAKLRVQFPQMDDKEFNHQIEHHGMKNRLEEQKRQEKIWDLLEKNTKATVKIAEVTEAKAETT